MKLIILILLGMVSAWPPANTQPLDESGTQHSEAVISRISVLSIHIGQARVHDSLFHFLTEKLGLPVEYYPLQYADRWYAGVFAGNMYLEPCGPYKNFKYALKDFTAIFFGLNCESQRSVSSLADDLTSRNIDIIATDAIQVIDTSFIRQNIYLNIVSKQESDPKQALREDSLRTEMRKTAENYLGIESIKEIKVGYADGNALKKWKEFIGSSGITPEGLWKVNEDQSVRFIKSNICEVSGIAFKVKSLKKAKEWLIENNLAGNIRPDEVEMDRLKTFGLSICISE